MAHKRIKVSPIAGALGAEIGGVDLSKELDNETYDDIHQAFLDHLVIFFRDQDLSVEQHKAFGRHFGPLHRHPFVSPLAGEPDVLSVTKEAGERTNPGGQWHSDVSFAEEPPLGSALYAVELPPFGDDTMWFNQYLAYETLSDGFKKTLECLRSVHGLGRYYDPNGGRYEEKRSISLDRTKAESVPESVHPIVRVHPETGRKALYVNPAFTMRIDGWTADESRPLLQFLYAHAMRPEFTCRLRWQPHSLALWDNRCTMHHAINDYHGHRREMRRVTIAGSRP